MNFRKMLRCWIGLLMLASLAAPLRATHIVGADLYYECINPVFHQYRVTLKMYRDCARGQAPFDDPVVLFIFDGASGAVVQTLNMPKPPQTPQLEPVNWDACVGTPYTICVEEGIYTGIVTLPPRPGGYDLAWARCCRNSAIDNLRAPLGEGITFLAHIPPAASGGCNSMPTFNQVPPIFLCAGQPFNFNHGATDPDGDSLVYALVNPYNGMDLLGRGAGNSQINPGDPPPVVNAGNPMGPPPYANVAFNPGYTYLDPFGSGNFNIDPRTGFIQVTPNQPGIFVMAISVFEYRNGVLLSENRRDFQIHVLRCRLPDDPPLINHFFGALPHSGDTLYVDANQPFCYDVVVRDSNITDTLVAASVSAAFGNGTFTAPLARFVWTGINPLQGQVCWQSACAYANQLIPLILTAYDINDCPNINNVFDTVWVRVRIPPNLPPRISPNLSGLQVIGDTIFVRPNQAFCIPFEVTDPDARDSLRLTGLSPVFRDPDGPSLSWSGVNPLQGQVCWTPGCSRSGALLPLEFAAYDDPDCQGALWDTLRLFVKIIPPPNGPPVITPNLSGLNVQGDTITVAARSAFCFDFTVTDPEPGDSLSAVGSGPAFSGASPAQLRVTGLNPLQGRLCWQPGCEYEGMLIPIVLSALSRGECGSLGVATRTLYVRVTVPGNRAPRMRFDYGSLPRQGDTLVVSANQGFCVRFEVDDPDAGDTLQAFPLSPLLNSVGGPVFNWTGINPLQGQVCWTPGCQYAGQLIPLVIGAGDNGICSSRLTTGDTFYVKINIPPNNPPRAQHRFGNLKTRGDTILIEANERLCYEISFTDIDAADQLQAFALSPVFSGVPAATLRVTGSNPLTAVVCWTPDCSYEGKLIPFVVGANDNGACNNSLYAYDTVWVRILRLNGAAPQIITDLTGNRYRGDTLFMSVGDSICYSFMAIDRSKGSGFGATFQFQDLNGANLGYGYYKLEQRGDTIYGRVCFKAYCGNGGTTYRMLISAFDQGKCPPFPGTQKALYLRVKATFFISAGADAGFCEGSGGVQLNAVPYGGSGPYSYQWGCTLAPLCGFSNPNVANPVVNPAQSATYFVQMSDANGCRSEIDSVKVTVWPNPIVDAGPDRFFCEGDPGVLLQGRVLNAAQLRGPLRWMWSPTAGLSQPNQPTTYARPDTSTIYTLQVFDARGCSSYTTTLDTLSTALVQLRERPRVDAGPDIHICFRDSSQLIARVKGPPPPYRYEWTPQLGLNDSSIMAPMLSPPQTVTYFLVAWARGCPSEADSVTVHVHTIPTVDPGPVRDICQGDSLRLPGLAGGDISTTDYSYRWTPGAGLSDSTAAQPWAFPRSSTTYRLQAVSRYGCGNVSQDTRVVVAPTPIAVAGPGGYICRGDSFQLQGSHRWEGPSGSPVEYRWEAAEGIRDLYLPSPKASPSQTMLYRLHTRHLACSSSDVVKVDVLEGINNLRVGADTLRICQGDSVRLFAGGGLGNARFQWTPSTSLDDPNSASPIARPAASTTFRVNVQEGKCQDRDSVRITVLARPDPAYLLHVPTGCDEDMTVVVQAQAAPAAYSWNFGDGSPVSNERQAAHRYAAPGAYRLRLTVTGFGGCAASDSSRLIELATPGRGDFASVPGPDAALPLPQAALQLEDLSQGAIAWHWDFGDGRSSSAQHPLHHYESPGDFYVTLWITDSLGCVQRVQKGPYRIYAPELFIPNVFTPNGDGFNEFFALTYTGKERFSVEVFDRWGAPVFHSTDPAFQWDGSLQGSSAASGVYFYVLRVGEKLYKGNVMLLR